MDLHQPLNSALWTPAPSVVWQVFPCSLLVRAPKAQYETVWANTKYTPVGVFLLRSELRSCVFLITEQIFGWPWPLQAAQFDFVQYVPPSRYRSNWISSGKFFKEYNPKTTRTPTIDLESQEPYRIQWVDDLFTDPTNYRLTDPNQEFIRKVIVKYSRSIYREEITAKILTPITDVTSLFFTGSFTVKAFKVVQAVAVDTSAFKRKIYPIRNRPNNLFVPS